jgi:hypothetical protein
MHFGCAAELATDIADAEVGCAELGTTLAEVLVESVPAMYSVTSPFLLKSKL